MCHQSQLNTVITHDLYSNYIVFHTKRVEFNINYKIQSNIIETLHLQGHFGNVTETHKAQLGPLTTI